MSFSCKIVLADYVKSDNSQRVYLRAIIDRKKATVPLGFYLTGEEFDERRQCMKKGHPNKEVVETVLRQAIAKANNIAARYMVEEKFLTPKEFCLQFTNPSSKIDFIKFMKDELKGNEQIAVNTRKNRQTVINDLMAFRKPEKKLPFAAINIDMVQIFQNYLQRQKNTPPTINKKLIILKQYMETARLKGHTFKDPFVAIKIKTFKPNRRALVEEELKQFESYYSGRACPARHRKVLRYFLFSCYTGVRISDIQVLTWANIHGDLLIFQPVKTRYKNKTVTVPLSPQAKFYLPDHEDSKANRRKRRNRIFDTNSDPVTNRFLKEIADAVGVKKFVTYHFSRHTFGTLFADGGNVVAMKEIMGHESILTSMGYVHVQTKLLQDAVKQRFGDNEPHQFPAKTDASK